MNAKAWRSGRRSAKRTPRTVELIFVAPVQRYMHDAEPEPALRAASCIVTRGTRSSLARGWWFREERPQLHEVRHEVFVEMVDLCGDPPVRVDLQLPHARGIVGTPDLRNLDGLERTPAGAHFVAPKAPRRSVDPLRRK